eukprot:4062031-Amphidinium_carterae.2
MLRTQASLKGGSSGPPSVATTDASTEFYTDVCEGGHEADDSDADTHSDAPLRLGVQEFRNRLRTLGVDFGPHGRNPIDNGYDVSEHGTSCWTQRGSDISSPAGDPNHYDLSSQGLLMLRHMIVLCMDVTCALTVLILNSVVPWVSTARIVTYIGITDEVQVDDGVITCKIVSINVTSLIHRLEEVLEIDADIIVASETRCTGDYIPKFTRSLRARGRQVVWGCSVPKVMHVNGGRYPSHTGVAIIARTPFMLSPVVAPDHLASTTHSTRIQMDRGPLSSGATFTESLGMSPKNIINRQIIKREDGESKVTQGSILRVNSSSILTRGGLHEHERREIRLLDIPESLDTVRVKRAGQLSLPLRETQARRQDLLNAHGIKEPISGNQLKAFAPFPKVRTITPRIPTHVLTMLGAVSQVR